MIYPILEEILCNSFANDVALKDELFDMQPRVWADFANDIKTFSVHQAVIIDLKNVISFCIFSSQTNFPDIFLNAYGHRGSDCTTFS